MTTIAPNNANWIYSPLNWDVTSGRAKTIDAGAYARIMFDGNPGTLAATFDMTNQPAGKTRISIRLDGGPWLDTMCAASVALTIPDNGWPSHTVELVMRAHSSAVDRWASPQPSALLFTGLTTTSTVTPRASRVRPYRLLLAGDSMLEGVSTWDDEPTKYEDKNDARYAWGYPLGDLLGAEVGVVGFGGLAWADRASPSDTAGVPKAQDSLPYLWSGQARSLAGGIDGAVFNFGTNDDIGGSTDAAVTAGVAATLNWFHGQAPSAPVVIVPGWVNHRAPAITAGIAASTHALRTRLVDTTGWWASADSSDGLHPWGYINTNDLAPRLASIIAPLLGAPTGGRYLVTADHQLVAV